LALRGDSSIPEETRNRILLAARDLNYTYVSRAKRGQMLNDVKHLVYVVKDYGDSSITENPFYGQILSGVEQTCQEQGAKLGFVVLPPDHPDLEALPHALVHHVDGIIMSSPYPRNIIQRVADASGCPIVLVDNIFPGTPCDTVMIDDFGGAYQVTQHLLELGHTKIKVLMGYSMSLDVPPSFRERYRGYCAACEDAGVTPLPATIIPADVELPYNPNPPERYSEWFASLIQSEPEITAIFGVNDLYAIRTVHELQRLNYRVPQDYSVVGFDDDNMASLINPPLTTVRSSKRMAGVLAARQLLSRLAGDTMPPIHSTVGTDLIVRRSSAASRT
jgi:DNA-binding LacI/PurR family transcriptional regulator